MRDINLKATEHFEAVARLGSVTRAAEELMVSPSAVSQQIKQLEEWLGFRLFVRLPRRLTLTDEGARLKAAVGPAYEAVDLEIGRLSGGNLSGIVKVRALPSFMAKWLVPRLGKFEEKHPQVDVWLSAGIGLFVVGWGFQFIGHYYEGRKPAFVDDLMGLIVGPLFVVAELGFLIGLGKKTQAQVEAIAGPVRRREAVSA